MDKSTFQLDFEFKSIAQPDGSLILRGYAATHALDRDKEMFTPEALKSALAGYLSNPIVLLGHDAQKVIGKITSAVVDKVGVFVEAMIPAPADGTEPWAVKAYHDIKNGLYRAFSVGGLFGKAKGSGGQIIQMDWMETSIVAVPSNPTALFEVVRKSFDLNADGSPVTKPHEHTVGDCISVARAQEIDRELRRVMGALGADLDSILARP